MEKTSISLYRPVMPWTWINLYKLYIEAFPPAERKMFRRILKCYFKRTTDIWCIKQKGRFVGFATTINGDNLVLLDYLATTDKVRNKGIGAVAVRELLNIYKGQGFFVEVESPYEEGEDQEIRQRRKAFYLRNGLVQLNVMAEVFGVKMELLGNNCHMTYDRYKQFYHDYYSEKAASRVKPEIHPDA